MTNSSNSRRQTTIDVTDERGVSNTVSIVLLVGMVITGATVLLYTGNQSLTSLERGIGAESQEMNLREIDSKVSSLAFDANRDNVSVRFGDLGQDRVSVDRTGSLEVTLNRRAACSANISFSSIRIEEQDGDVRAYEMGGIWTKQGGRSIMESPPTLRYDNGTITASVFNFSGRIQSETVRMFKNVSKSDNRTLSVRSALYDGPCQQADNVTLTVRSDFYTAWYNYLRSEVNATSIVKYAGNRSVVVFLNQSRLPAYTNESVNRVVNLNGTGYVDVATHNNAIEVTKNASVNYTVTLTPLAKGVQVGNLESFDSAQVYRPPIDVVFVMDESGSMDNDAGAGFAISRYQAARNAMRLFLGLLNASRDRAGLVGFHSYEPDQAKIFKPGGRYLTNDFDELNATIATTRHSGGTYINAGLREGFALLDHRSNNSRERIMILLTDGKNNPSSLDDETKAWARRANESGITVYTIGFGGNADEALLKEIANLTGGNYYFASNASELNEVFKDIALAVTETRALARPPVSLNMTAGSTTFYPQIGGDPAYVANATSPSGEPIYNVNDPESPRFSMTFSVADGRNISMNALSYDCADWTATNQVLENNSSGQTYTVVRCAEIQSGSKTVVEPENVTIYRDGADIEPLLDEAEATDTWWQADLRNETLAPYLTNGSTILDLPSNTAIVVFDYGDSGNGNNRLVALLEIGRPEASTSARGVVIITVNEVSIRPGE